METIQKSFEILEFVANSNGTTDSSFKPKTIKRLSDNEVFTIDDAVIQENLEIVGFITGFSLLEDNVYVEHTYSKVGLNLESIKKHKDINFIHFKFDNLQVVKVKFMEEEITATIQGIHFYKNNVKYDLKLWLKNGEETRIYNVEEKFLTAV